MDDNSDLFAAFGAPDENKASTSSGHDDLKAAFAEGSKNPLEPTLASTAMSPVTGFNKALISLGTPVDLVHAALKKGVYEPLGYEAPEEPFGGTASIRRGLAAVGVEPEAERYLPRSRAEQVLQAGGEGVGQAMTLAAAAPSVTSRLAGQYPRIAEAVETLFAARPAVGTSKAAAAAPIAELAVPAFTGGAGAELASEMVPEHWKGLAGMGGGLAGGTIGAATVGAAKSIPFFAGKVSDYLAPITKEGQYRTAAEKLAQGIENRTGILDTIANEPREIIPGSKPTLFELTGEGGNLQRQAERVASDKFNERRGEQTAARMKELGKVTPETEATELPKFFQSQIQEMDRLGDSAAEWAAQRAREEVEKLGGAGTPEEYGSLLRGYLQAAKESMRQARAALYRAVDPDGTINTVTAPLRDKAASFVANRGEYETPLTGEAKRLFEQAQSMPDVLPFRDILDFDKAVTGAMSTERRTSGESPLWGQLSQLKTYVQDAINNAVENQAKYEATAVKNGEKAADDTIGARIQQWIDEFKGGTKTAKEELTPNMTAEDAARLKAAKEKHVEYATTFKQGPVGSSLETTGFSGQFKSPDAAVVAKFFPGRQGGFEAASAFRQAVGNDAKAIELMKDYIAWSVRNHAEKPDGTLDVKQFDKWRKKHESALRAFPELEGSFDDAVKAAKTLDDLGASRTKALKNYQQGVVEKVLGLDEGQDIANTIGGLFGKSDTVKQMKSLAEKTAGDQTARDALKRSIADYMAQKFVTTTEAGASGQDVISSAKFQKFIRDNERALGMVFDENELKTMQDVAADLHRANRSISGTSIPGRSTTAQDILPDLKNKQVDIGPFGKAALGAEAGQTFGGAKGVLLGLLAAGGNALTVNMRKAGMENVNDMIVRAMLEPDFAAELLKSVKQREGYGAVQTLSRALQRLPAIGFSGTLEGEPESGPMEITVRPKAKPEKFAGGRIGRASGGRIAPSRDIDMAADALVHAAESTKKVLGKQTEVLLNQDDNTIAHALEVANKAI